MIDWGDLPELTPDELAAAEALGSDFVRRLLDKPRLKDIRRVRVDGVLTWKLRCPRCKTWQSMDDDQFYGLVSIQCGVDGCDYHRQEDLSELITQAP